MIYSKFERKPVRLSYVFQCILDKNKQAGLTVYMS